MDANLKESLQKLLKSYNTMHTSSDNGSHDERYVQLSSIINNNATNQAGYALDARQANPNIDGSMANQILAIQNTCESIKSDIAELNERVAYLESGGLDWGTF